MNKIDYIVSKRATKRESKISQSTERELIKRQLNFIGTVEKGGNIGSRRDGTEGNRIRRFQVIAINLVFHSEKANKNHSGMFRWFPIGRGGRKTFFFEKKEQNKAQM